MVNICQEGHSQRLAPQKRHMAHLRQHTRETRAAGIGEVIRHMALKESALAKHLVT